MAPGVAATSATTSDDELAGVPTGQETFAPVATVPRKLAFQVAR